MRGDKTEKSKWAICGMIVGAIAVGIGIVNPYSIENFDLLLFMPPPVTFNLFFQF